MKNTLLFIALSIIAGICHTQTANVVGYLPSYRFSSSSQIEYCKLTHLNLCFANPDGSGNIVMPSISSVLTDAQNGNPNIIICISLAGGALSTQQASDWSNLIDIPANRPGFIANIVNYTIANDLDGVDVDLEWGHVTSGYSDFIVELDAALTAENKILTVAFPNQTLFSNVTSAALSSFDFINIMAYDATGPWNPSAPGQHSSYNFANDGINFWKNSVGIPANKLTLGVPFYGYEFVNPSTVNAVTYSQMVAIDTTYADLDNVGNIYYNGRPTIASKVDLAVNEVGGIMIWELGQDSFDQFTLLGTIHDKFTALNVTTTGLCGNGDTLSVVDQALEYPFIVYPNPTRGSITVEMRDSYSPFRTKLRTLKGQIINTEELEHSGKILLDIEGDYGFYFLEIITPKDEKSVIKILKE